MHWNRLVNALLVLTSCASVGAGCGGDGKQTTVGFEELARKSCDRRVQCGDVAVACGDTLAGSVCQAKLTPVDAKQCDSADAVSDELAQCESERGEDGELRRLYEACVLGSLDAPCASEEDLKTWYANPIADPAARPDLAQLPASCIALRSALSECRRPEGAAASR
ncbi:MAG: hypothetical protein ABW252_20165 [Polyangiales bacterium]